MIIIQLFLLASIMYFLLKFLSDRSTSKTKAWKKIILILFCCIAIVTILNPNLANSVAHVFGVGRGADLLLYILVAAFLFQQLNAYLKAKDEQERFVKLARKVAILEANHRQDK